MTMHLAHANLACKLLLVLRTWLHCSEARQPVVVSLALGVLMPGWVGVHLVGFHV